jgi:hypothetical protein
VHHVVYRVNIQKKIDGKRKSITDGVHVLTSQMSEKEKNSQKIKELKQQILLNIVDKFQVCIVYIVAITELLCDI